MPRLRYSRFLDPSNAVFLRWDFDFEAEIITFELQVRTAGWVGLGVTDRYSRAGSDLVVGGVSPDGNVYFSVSLRVALSQACWVSCWVEDDSESRKDPYFPNSLQKWSVGEVESRSSRLNVPKVPREWRHWTERESILGHSPSAGHWGRIQAV